jgi:hypothetical protein
MPLTTDDIEVVIFDYGNTLVPFGQAQLRACDAALAGVLGGDANRKGGQLSG